MDNIKNIIEDLIGEAGHRDGPDIDNLRDIHLLLIEAIQLHAASAYALGYSDGQDNPTGIEQEIEECDLKNG
jgi:hypothetical protein